MTRERSYRQSLGVLSAVIKKAPVLMVGAGGIGCELLKNLVLSGFGEIHIVDLDTIDLSNLNRQFLFRQEHIKKSKAVVAKDVASKFNPSVKIEAHHANIRDSHFDVAWFSQFKIVFNALDNLEARRHVNRMCLLAAVPLIESGTTGFKGQVQPIYKGHTECYDCNEKETPKSFPVCTIRSTPSMPIHCIVWAKSYLFAEVFGKSEDEADFDNTEDSENAAEIETLKEEAVALGRIRNSVGTADFARLLFDKVFSEDIRRLQGMEDMWKTRKMPNALSFADLKERAKNVQAAVSKDDQRPWSLEESLTVFTDSLDRLSQRFLEEQKSATEGMPSPVLSFDKDDEDMLDFVAAAANLRSLIFHISTKSKFDIKQMAGNIIPAIATTNAMTAGLCVLEAFKMLRGQLNKAKQIFLEAGSTQRAFGSELLRGPNPHCAVCNQSSGVLDVDIQRATVKDLVDTVLKEKLDYSDEFSVRKESTVLFDPDFDDNLSKTFAELQLKTGQVLTVVDEEEDNPRIDLVLILKEKSFETNSKPIELAKELEIRRKPTTNGTIVAGALGAVGPNSLDLKRKREADVSAAAENDLKRAKAVNGTQNDEEGNAVVIDDSGTGPIVLDD